MKNRSLNWSRKQESFRGFLSGTRRKNDRTLIWTRKLHSTQYFILVSVLYVISFFKWKKFGLDILKLSCQTYDFIWLFFSFSNWTLDFLYVEILFPFSFVYFRCFPINCRKKGDIRNIKRSTKTIQPWIKRKELASFFTILYLQRVLKPSILLMLQFFFFKLDESI